jgi:DNA-binding NarL/FixJ family response regulator
MPIKNGIQATIEIKAKFPTAKVLMLTAFDGDEEIHKALQAGAQGYVFKNSSGEKLIPALRSVLAGQRWIPKEVANRLASRKSFEELTQREIQILNVLAKGLANKEIADVLNITEYTVKDHLKNILAKLRVSDRTEAVTTAIQRGIIHL